MPGSSEKLNKLEVVKTVPEKEGEISRKNKEKPQESFGNLFQELISQAEKDPGILQKDGQARLGKIEESVGISGQSEEEKNGLDEIIGKAKDLLPRLKEKMKMVGLGIMAMGAVNIAEGAVTENIRKGTSMSNQPKIEKVVNQKVYENKFKKEKKEREDERRAEEIRCEIEENISSIKYLERLENEFSDPNKTEAVIKKEAKQMQKKRLEYIKTLKISFINSNEMKDKVISPFISSVSKNDLDAFMNDFTKKESKIISGNKFYGWAYNFINSREIAKKIILKRLVDNFFDNNSKIPIFYNFKTNEITISKELIKSEKPEEFDDLVRKNIFYASTNLHRLITPKARKILKETYDESIFGSNEPMELIFNNWPAERLAQAHMVQYKMEKWKIKDYGQDFKDDHYKKFIYNYMYDPLCPKKYKIETDIKDMKDELFICQNFINTTKEVQDLVPAGFERLRKIFNGIA